MTGLLGRLRAWLFGESDDADDTDEERDESSPRVVHRDDRPLETPGTMERPDPPTPSERDESAGPVDIPDAESGDDGPVSTSARDASDADVSIPDAESTAADDDVTDSPEMATGGNAVATANAVAESEAGAADETDADSTTTDDADEDTEFACSVCGTAVDDPSVSCPLCRSTDVVPVDDAPTDGDTPSRGGRTTVSTDDDEAADRLNDVRSADEH